MDREPGSPRGGKESDTTERLTHRSALEMQHVAVFPPCGFQGRMAVFLQTLGPALPGHPTCGLSLGQPEAWGLWEPHQGCDPAWQPLTCASPSPEGKGPGFREHAAAGKSQSSLPRCARAPHSPWLQASSFVPLWGGHAVGLPVCVSPAQD